MLGIGVSISAIPQVQAVADPDIPAADCDQLWQPPWLALCPVSAVFK